MAIVNKFNVNNKQVTLDADIIENMSANDVSYNDSSKYDKNTVGDKLSELDNAINSSEQKYIKDETIGIENKVTKHEKWYYSDFIDYVAELKDINETLKEVMMYHNDDNYTNQELDDYINTIKKEVFVDLFSIVW